jgi:arsenate reductase (glutaredoxin)
MITIYHNPRCAKSRAGLKYINDNNIEHNTIEYLKEGLCKDEIKMLAHRLGAPTMDLIRTQEAYFKENIKGKLLSDEELFSEIANNLRLLQRPIVVNGEKAVLAQPADKINELF